MSPTSSDPFLKGLSSLEGTETAALPLLPSLVVVMVVVSQRMAATSVKPCRNVDRTSPNVLDGFPSAVNDEIPAIPTGPISGKTTPRLKYTEQYELTT